MTHPKAQPLSAREELAGLPLVQLIERLRGKYTIPVNDGAGPLNGSMEFTREFETSPIDHEAATRLEMMTATIATRDARIEQLEKGLCKVIAHTVIGSTAEEIADEVLRGVEP